jgi:hypothetical protein
MGEIAASNRIGEILSAVPGPLVEGKYLHWDRLRYYASPNLLL